MSTAALGAAIGAAAGHPGAGAAVGASGGLVTGTAAGAQAGAGSAGDLQVGNRDGTLLPGVYVQVKFVITGTNPAWLIPANTLVIRADGSQVAIVGADERVHYQIVDIGHDYGNEVEIVSGLNGSESLITQPHRRFPVALLSTQDGGAANAGE